jgi:hypothetical protein
MAEPALGRAWIRAGGVAAIVAAVLEVASGIAAGGAPAANSSTSKITDYLTSHRSGILTQTVLAVAGLAVALWFLGTVARLIQTRDGRSPLGLISLAAGAAAVAVAAFDGLTLTVLVFVVKEGGLTDPSLTHAFFDLENGVVMPGAFGFMIAVFLIALGVAIIRGAFAAPWVGWLSLVLAALSVLSGVLGLTLTNGGTTPFSYFPAAGFGLVAIISGIFMIRDGGELPS